MLIKADGIHKSFTVGQTTLNVLNGAYLDVAPGETVAIVGHSGAGKSTLLQILGGLDRPDSGRVFIDTWSMYDISPAQRTSVRARHIGFVFQAYHLMPELTVMENCILPGMTGMGPYTNAAELRKRGLELLSSVGLSHRAQHLPMELSGGEQQRLALCRALMNNPRIILADEPTGNLDAETGQQVLDYVFSLAAEHNSTLLMVTHNAELAAQCGRVLHLSEGRLATL